MGNALDSAPKTYSASDPTKMQGDPMGAAWLQTYRHDPYAHTDRIPWGNKGSHLSIGAKVLQDVPGTDMYVQNAQGKKIFITKNGKTLPNAASLIQQDPNYGLGPLVEILGPPTDPQYYMWTGTEMTAGDAYKPVKINSMKDLEYAMTSNTNPNEQSPALDHQHSGQYGEASISGPFQKLPKDVWSAVGQENAVIGAIGGQLVVPIAADAISSVIPGFGQVTQTLGLQQDLTDALTKAVDGWKKNMQYKPTSTFNTAMSNVITDPRLNQTYVESHAGYTNLVKQTKSHDEGILAMPNSTPEQRMLKARALQAKAADMQADQQAQQVESLMAQLKVKYPKLDWSYYDSMQSGIQIAGTTDQKLNIISHFSDKLVADVQQAKAAQAEADTVLETGNLESQMTELKQKYPNLDWAYYDQMKYGLEATTDTDAKQNILNHFSDKLADDIAAQKAKQDPQPAQTTTPPPKGSGFGPVSWNPLVINGAFREDNQQVVIHG